MADFSAPAASSTLSLTATATGAGASTAVRPDQSKFASIQVKGTGGAATGWTVVLQGSLDGTNWTNIRTHGTADGDGVVLFAGDNIPRPVAFVRLNVTALTLGTATNIVCTAVVAG